MICPVCHKDFFPLQINMIYCSKRCRDLNNHRKRQAKRLAARLVRLQKICPICGKSFVAKSDHFKYCSDECSHNAFKSQNNSSYQRNKEKRRAYRRKNYLKNRDTILAKQRAKYREKVAEKSKTPRPRKVKVKTQSETKTAIHPLKHCAFCGNEFISKNSLHIYCSITCRRKAEFKNKSKQLPKKLPPLKTAKDFFAWRQRRDKQKAAANIV